MKEVLLMTQVECEVMINECDEREVDGVEDLRARAAPHTSLPRQIHEFWWLNPV